MRIERLQAFSCRAPTDKPVATSFGIMHDRPAVFLRVEDADGCFGWGEVFANWPAAGAEHRVNLLHRDISPLVLGQDSADPASVFAELTEVTYVRALQCGEFGPFNQVIAGIDTALWDLAARRSGQPLRKLLNADAKDRVPAYASGIHISSAAQMVTRARRDGFRAFKVKVGFDPVQDVSSVQTLSDDLRPDERLFSDANQAFDVTGACRFLDGVRNARLDWLEEPLVADASKDHWAQVARASTVPLAGGENIAGFQDFGRVIKDGHLTFIQPDVAKWGGVTGCLRVARAALKAGHVYCPHFLGGGIGLAASAEVLAAAGGPGLLEVDINTNPLRSAFEGFGVTDDGDWLCSTRPGLGIDALPEALHPLITHRIDLTNRGHV